MLGPRDRATSGSTSKNLPAVSMEPSTDSSPLQLSPATTQLFKAMLASTRNVRPAPVTTNVSPVSVSASQESSCSEIPSLGSKSRKRLKASNHKTSHPRSKLPAGAPNEPSPKDLSHSEPSSGTEPAATPSPTHVVSPAPACENLPPRPRCSIEELGHADSEPSRKAKRKNVSRRQLEEIVQDLPYLQQMLPEDRALSPPGSPPIYSPPEETFSDERGLYDRAEVPRSTALYAWICAVTGGSLALPAGLLILSFFTQEPPPHALTQTPIATSGSTWATTNSSCLVTQNIYNDVNNLYSGTVTNKWVLSSSMRLKTICCLYNNSRYHKPDGWDYLPKHVPVDLCPCLVYWSMGIRDGRLVSRVPEFDKRFGLRQLNRLKGAGQVLVTVGGYRSDSIHFSRLGEKRSLMTRFVADVLDELLDSKLDGINIHWTYPNDTCGRSDDWNTLLILIEELRDLFYLNAKNFSITVMLTWDDVLSNRADILSKVNRAFIDTHSRDFESDPWNACGTNVDRVTRVLRYLLSKCNASTGRVCTCVSSSIMPWAVTFALKGGTVQKAEKISTSFNISQLPGRAAFYELCNVRLSVLRIPSVLDCKIHVNDTNPAATQFPAYLVHSYNAILKLVNVFGCILLYDIDFDIYKSGCRTFRVGAGLSGILNAQPFSPG